MNFFRRLWPFSRNRQESVEPIVLESQPSYVGGFSMPFTHLRKKKKRKKDLIIDFLSPLLLLLTGAFSVNCLANFWGFDTVFLKVCSIVGAVVITYLEILAFCIFAETKGYWSFVFGLAFSLISVLGSYGSFQVGISKQEKEASAYERALDRIDKLDQQLKVYKRQQEVYEEQPGPLGNVNNRIERTNKEIKEIEKKLDNYIEKNVGASTEMFESLAATTETDTDTAKRRGLIFIAIILECGLIFVTIWKSVV